MMLADVARACPAVGGSESATLISYGRVKTQYSVN